MATPPRPQGREAIKAWNRQKIIDATIDVITRHGIAGTTIAKVVKLADVSMGLVNVHFKNKETLLNEVLRQMAYEYQEHWKSRLDAASEEPVAQLTELIMSDFDSSVLNLRTLGVWFTFRAHARACPQYVELVGSRDHAQMQKTVSLLRQINQKTNHAHDTETLALALTAMLDGMWADYFLYPKAFDRQKALNSVLMFLAAMYPGYFSNNIEIAPPLPPE